MKKRYIVSIDGNTTDQEVASFSAYINENKLYWWHWLSNTWLLIDHAEVVDAQKLRDKAIQIFGGKNNLVLEIPEGGTWFGYGPNTPEKNMFKWIKDCWQ